MERRELEKMLEGKVVKKAELNHGTVKLFFSDGTCFHREKTCEGEVMAVLYGKDGTPVTAVRI